MPLQVFYAIVLSYLTYYLLSFDPAFAIKLWLKLSSAKLTQSRLGSTYSIHTLLAGHRRVGGAWGGEWVEPGEESGWSMANWYISIVYRPSGVDLTCTLVLGPWQHQVSQQAA